MIIILLHFIKDKINNLIKIMENIIEKNTEDIKVPTMPKYVTSAEELNETLSSFTTEQKQTLNDIFERRYSMLENLSK